MKLYREDGTLYEPTYEEPVAVGTDQFWDRSLKLWTVFAIDAEGYQVGETHYANNKRELPATIEYALYVVRAK